uniref:Uncharacterized protein n=1 Tax=Panagrolaimus sp. JU765 TaxID=591449 RepID=A0AC34QTB4_9BILA
MKRESTNEVFTDSQNLSTTDINNLLMQPSIFNLLASKQNQGTNSSNTVDVTALQVLASIAEKCSTTSNSSVQQILSMLAMTMPSPEQTSPISNDCKKDASSRKNSCQKEPSSSESTPKSSDMLTSAVSPQERVLSMLPNFNMLPRTFAIPSMPNIKKPKYENGWF